MTLSPDLGVRGQHLPSPQLWGGRCVLGGDSHVGTLMSASVEKEEITELDPYWVRAGCCDAPKFWVMILSEAPLRCG